MSIIETGQLTDAELNEISGGENTAPGLFQGGSFIASRRALADAQAKPRGQVRAQLMFTVGHMNL